MKLICKDYDQYLFDIAILQLMEQELSTQRPLDLHPEGSERPKYGNLCVLYEGTNCMMTLGPDCNPADMLDWCFVPAFIIFTVIGSLMTVLVFWHSDNIYFQIVTVLINGAMSLSYFLVATANPGVVLEEDQTDLQENEINPRTKRLCKRCHLRVRKGTVHCSECDVCIEEYDHHCPWTSKCIGKGNICRFYVFLGIVPIFIIYTFISFSIVMSQTALAHTTRHTRTH